MARPKAEHFAMLLSAGNWSQILAYYDRHFKSSEPWIFRGQGDPTWGFKSSLERQGDALGIEANKLRTAEKGLLRRFSRQCHQYVSEIPSSDDTLEWLALMQHHGSPTRLLDWTYSFFVALYFALEDSKRDTAHGDDTGSCAVWALNTRWMKGPFDAVLERHPVARKAWRADTSIVKAQTFTKIFLPERPISIVGAVTPQRLNPRLVIQQGTFLCPGDLTKSFEDNLVSLLAKAKHEAHSNFIKLTIQVNLDAKKDILLHLHHMNMNRATLFPGLDGFAQSLKIWMAFPPFWSPSERRR